MPTYTAHSHVQTATYTAHSQMQSITAPLLPPAVALQPPTAAKRDQYPPQVPDPSAGRGTPPDTPPVLPHHASFPEIAAELVLDWTVEGHNAASSSTAYTGFGDRPAMAGPDQVNILNLPLPDFDTMSGELRCYFPFGFVA